MKGMISMDEIKYNEDIEKILSLSKEDLDKIFSQFSLVQIDALLNMIDTY